MRAVAFYRYPHPMVPKKWVYTGQTVDPARRDITHRLGRDGFGRRFKRLFPGIKLPEMEVGWHEPVTDRLKAKLIETEGMFRFHTWRGYPGGMNLTLPGLVDYESLGKLGGSISGHITGLAQGKKNVETGHIVRLGRSQGRKNVDTGLLARVAPLGGHIGGHISGRMNVERGHLASLRTPEHQREAAHQAGLKTVALGIGIHAPGVAAKGGKTTGPTNGHKLGKSGIGNCLRWNVRRGKPCTCGHHS